MERYVIRYCMTYISNTRLPWIIEEMRVYINSGYGEPVFDQGHVAAGDVTLPAAAAARQPGFMAFDVFSLLLGLPLVETFSILCF